MKKKVSKNNPESRIKQEVSVRTCEFCGSDKGVHSAKRMKRMVWVCNLDSCIRFK